LAKHGLVGAGSRSGETSHFGGASRNTAAAEASIPILKMAKLEERAGEGASEFAFLGACIKLGDDAPMRPPCR
jgi:hypothetical protein